MVRARGRPAALPRSRLRHARPAYRLIVACPPLQSSAVLWPTLTVKRRLGRRYRQIESILGRALFERGDFAQTAGVEYFGDRAIGAENHHYAPSSYFMLPRAIRRREVSASDVFLEVGSGKGRVVCQAASRYRFKRVIGVDLEEAWNAVARRNVEVNRHRFQCKDIEIITADVGTWTVPEDVTYVYMYNPFSAEVLERFVSQLVASLDRRSRELTVIYAKPLHGQVLARSGRFVRLRYLRGLRPRNIDRHISIWHSVTPRDGDRAASAR